MKFHAIILARGNSKGIRNKNLVNINGKPLIFWSIKSALLSKKIEKVWVSSDSKKILKKAEKFGASTIIRPKNISGDNSSSEEGWIHAINHIKKNNEIIDYAVVLQATSPIRGFKDLDNAIDLIIKKKCDSLFSSTKKDAHFTWKKHKNKIIANYNLKEKRKTRQKILPEIIENGSFYIFSIKKFLKIKKRLFGKTINFNQIKFKSFELDEYEDILLLDTLLKYAPKKYKIIK